VSTKFTFDANFLDKFHAAAAADRQRILGYLRDGKLTSYANYEALREVMGLASTCRKENLIPFCGHVLELTKGKILNVVMGMISSELRGAFELEMGDGFRTEINQFLDQAARGHIPSRAVTIGEGAITDKQRAKKYFDEMFAAFEERFSRLGDAERTKISFEELQERHWRNMGQGAVEHLCSDAGITDGSAVAERVLANPSRYPHVRVWMKIFALMLHRYLVLRRSRETGDLFDLWQMNYLQDMDVFVTEERKLPAWYGDIFGTSRRVMNWEQFVATEWPVE
jgi:hypothetical protein